MDVLERKREGWKEVGKKVESCASLVKGVFVTGDGSKKGEFEDREPLSEDVPSVSGISTINHPETAIYLKISKATSKGDSTLDESALNERGSSIELVIEKCHKSKVQRSLENLRGGRSMILDLKTSHIQRNIIITHSAGTTRIQVTVIPVFVR
uniref:Uncharacterized protein n=1 Tax=Vespula pensylvanica TaxID=30213 RepID=A0A834U9K7_VESPE|nr:hypothetical protein H0235_009145 [Vespula pensylvanica]